MSPAIPKIFLPWLAFLLAFACSSGGSEPRYGALTFTPAATITVEQATTPKALPLLVHNGDESLSGRLLKAVFRKDDGNPLTVVEFSGVRHYRMSSSAANYYLRLRLDPTGLVVLDEDLLSAPSKAARITDASGQDLCDAQNNPVALKGPNWCDIMVYNGLVNQALLTAYDGIEVFPEGDRTVAPLAPRANPGDASAYALEAGIHVCGSTATLTPEDIRRQDPYEDQDIYRDDDPATVDEAKLLEYCESSVGQWNQNLLSLGMSAWRFSSLPLEVLALAEPTDGQGQAPAVNIYLDLDQAGGAAATRILVRFAEAAVGNPVADLLMGSVAGNVLAELSADGSASSSPLGAAREPLSYLWQVDSGLEHGLAGVVLPRGMSPGTTADLAGTYGETSRVGLWLPLAGPYNLSLTVKDNAGLTSQPATRDITGTAPGWGHVELWWDNPDAVLRLALVRKRPSGTYLVPPLDQDMIRPPSGIACTSDADTACKLEGVQYFCSGMGDGSLRCTYHPDGSHEDTCFAGNPNPVWGGLSDPDDDPRFMADWDPPGPKVVGISRPASGIYRVVVTLDPSSPRTIGKSNPVTAYVRVHLKGQASQTQASLYFRPTDSATPDIPVWKVGDIVWQSSGAEVTWLDLKDQDCYVGLCRPYANPMNAVLDTPFDPRDPNSPRSIWCDQEGDTECEY